MSGTFALQALAARQDDVAAAERRAQATQQEAEAQQAALERRAEELAAREVPQLHEIVVPILLIVMSSADAAHTCGKVFSLHLCVCRGDVTVSIDCSSTFATRAHSSQCRLTRKASVARCAVSSNRWKQQRHRVLNRCPKCDTF